MLLLVMGANYLVMFIGWEGVGLCSYLLIGFWFKNQDYNDAANKAFIMNRIGDLGMLLGVILIFVQVGSIQYTDVFAKH
jgi:NADH-quinone oxidoreductase subunit L